LQEIKCELKQLECSCWSRRSMPNESCV